MVRDAPYPWMGGWGGGERDAQLVSMTRPKELGPDESVETTVFVPIGTFSLDENIKKWTLTVDNFNNVTETNELNTYELSFCMCWPADLYPGPSVFVMHDDGVASTEVRF